MAANPESSAPVPDYVHEATKTRLLAEAKKFAAETLYLKAQALEMSQVAAMSKLTLAEKVRTENRNLAADPYFHVYRFLGEVNEKSVEFCSDVLTRWDRMEPGAPWTIIFNSPGGTVVPGLALYDFLTEMRRRHEITTVALGYAASMGGILLQAGTKRAVGAESWVLIHEVSAGMMGSFGELEDRMSWLAKVQSRILDIFTERSDGKKTKEDFEHAWKRKDFWLDSAEALEWGVVDEIW